MMSPRFLSLLLVGLVLSAVSDAAIVSSTITYQGSIKQSGVPVNGTYTIELDVTDSSGTACWLGTPQSVTITEGLYRMDISPNFDNCPNTDLYILTKINGSALSPSEKITSAPFALIARNLTTGATASYALAAQSLTPGATAQGDLSIGNGFLSLSDAGLGFKSEPSLSLYRVGTNVMGFKAGGAYRAMIAPSNTSFFNTVLPGNDGAYNLGQSDTRWGAVWAKNGAIQTSASRNKRDIREMVLSGPTVSVVPVAAAGLNAAASLSSDHLVTPRGIVFKWKDAEGKPTDQDIIGFMGDDLPLEAHAIRPDGTRDPDNFYTSSVVGILAARIRELETTVAALQQQVHDLKSAPSK